MSNTGIIISAVIVTLISITIFLYTLNLSARVIRAEQEKRIEQEKHAEEQSKEKQRKSSEMLMKEIELAYETAGKIVDTLNPKADAERRKELIESLLPNLLQLSTIKKLEIVLPTSDQKTKIDKEGQTKSNVVPYDESDKSAP